MPKREVTSAPWVPVPARACTGKAPRARQHRAVGRLSAGAAKQAATRSNSACGMVCRQKGNQISACSDFSSGTEANYEDDHAVDDGPDDLGVLLDIDRVDPEAYGYKITVKEVTA